MFETLKKIRKSEFVIIGGYAVNAYTLPRFSVDCDIVIKNYKELEKIIASLFNRGYKKSTISPETPYEGKFERYEKEISIDFKVSMDILIGGVFDRQTNAKFSADWVFENSKPRELKGKTIGEKLKIRIINPEALLVMKMLSSRLTDIRDIFLLISSAKDKEWIKKEISGRYNFQNRLSKAIKEISTKQFKDSLQRVFGLIDDKTFEKHKKLLIELESPTP